MSLGVRGLIGVGAIGIAVIMGFSEPEARPVAAAEKAAVSYAKDVQPILSASCYNCHNAKKKKAGVDLQSGFAGVQKIVSPMKPEESRLYKCLIGKGAKPMPPKNPLPEEQIAQIKNWIANGAKEK